MSEELGIPNNQLTNLYFNCMEVVENTWQQLTSPEPEQNVPEGEEDAPAGAATSEPNGQQ